MKFNDIIRLGVARPGGSGGSGGTAALPGILEQFGLRVFMEHIRTQDDFQSFWGQPAVDAQVTIIWCHGWGKTDADAVLNWPLFNPQKGEVEDYHLTPANMNEVAIKGSGVLVNMACWGGKQSYAEGFLKAGFEHYVAHTSTADMLSSLQFVTAFFGYLMWEQRDYGARQVEVSDAVEMARKIDDFPDGANGFRHFGR